MVKFYDSITPDLQEWAMKQAVFFVASAPLHGEHINLSPKGLPSSSFAIINPNLCAYVDATGSGIETIAHLQENGRCTVMFCSFDTSPRIMRFFCKGRAVAWNEPGFDDWLKRMGGKSFAGARAVILLDVFKVNPNHHIVLAFCKYYRLHCRRCPMIVIAWNRPRLEQTPFSNLRVSFDRPKHHVALVCLC